MILLFFFYSVNFSNMTLLLFARKHNNLLSFSRNKCILLNMLGNKFRDLELQRLQENVSRSLEAGDVI